MVSAMPRQESLKILSRLLMTAIAQGPSSALSSLLHEFNENHCPMETVFPDGSVRVIRSAYVEGDSLLFDSTFCPATPAQFIVFDLKIEPPPPAAPPPSGA